MTMAASYPVSDTTDYTPYLSFVTVSLSGRATFSADCCLVASSTSLEEIQCPDMDDDRLLPDTTYRHKQANIIYVRPLI